MGKKKAKMAISVDVEAKPEVEIWWLPKKLKSVSDFLDPP